MSRPRTVTTGVIADAHAVAQDHAPLLEALGPRGADVVLVEHLEQRAAQQARVDRGERRREHEPRQDQRLEPLDRRVARRACTPPGPRRRQAEDPEVGREQVQGDEAEPVDGRGDRDEREADGQAVEDRAVLDGGDDADGEAERQPDHHAAERERDRRGQVLEDLVEHVAVGDVAAPEVRYAKTLWM